MLLVTTGQLLTVGVGWSGWVDVLPWAAAAGSAELIGFAALYRAMISGPMGIAAPVAGLGVAIPVVAGLFTGSGLGCWQIVGLVVAAIGVLALAGGATSSANRRNLALAGVSGAGFGVALVALAHGAQVDEAASGGLMRMTTVPVLLGAWWWQRRAATRPAGRHRPVAPASVTVLPWLALALIAGVFDALGNLSFALASTRVSLSIAAVVGSSDPVVTALLARVYLAERLTRNARWGVAAAVLGAALTAAG